MLHRNRRHTKGQALVEFALAATLIFLLLTAAVDLGMMFFTVQGLNNAAQEGATYGSRWLTGPIGAARLDEDAIRQRVSLEAGDQGGIGFANLLDLNNNGIPDIAPDSGTKEINADTGNAVIDDYVEIYAWADIDLDGNPLPDATSCYDPNVSPGGNIAQSFYPCYIQVVVHADYDLVFPFAPAFDDEVQLSSDFVVLLR
ncbi:MAG: beta-glucosidase [Chloroflexi bacterium AL-W]|nr:beta-glucosidase [Chloroflexi bacterium AL-N1]NOK65738.1 beta-glucosidase [Chloroflexi bacterium AL-N10]NOK74321.1 beta-glucosidase [Chloroflexi bacterium AL-N5]NOK80771.1 beta-glucosidase [Chloroflexi bacterium AL-W]NOK88579.1 beta-glucosidase [Chloroflexi bacterium AL-N15]